MSIIKKLTICSMIGLLSLRMVACGSTDTNTIEEIVQTKDTLNAEAVGENTLIAKVGDKKILVGDIKNLSLNISIIICK